MENAQVNVSELMAELERVKAELAKSKGEKHTGPRALAIKVSQKGAVAIYGLGRFPVTLYKSQVDRLFAQDMVDKIRAFVIDHAAVLTVKTAIEPAPVADPTIKS